MEQASTNSSISSQNSYLDQPRKHIQLNINLPSQEVISEISEQDLSEAREYQSKIFQNLMKQTDDETLDQSLLEINSVRANLCYHSFLARTNAYSPYSKFKVGAAL